MRLDRDLVVGAALDLLNEVGIDGLTTRRLAAKLGVKQPALYWHFKNKRELLDEMAAHMITTDRTPPITTSDTWAESLKEGSRTFRQALLRYRDGGRVHAGTRPDAGLFPSLETRVRAMCEAGFTPDDALRAFMATGRFVVGWVIEEQAATADKRGELEEDLTPDAAAYPTLADGVAMMRYDDADTGFEFGLDALVAGLAVMKDAKKSISTSNDPTTVTD
jgi:TetR/AcrR family tetracycline transcriptional repressor